MDIKMFATVFGTILLAEIGDKTQLATLLYSAGTDSSKLTVFLGSALALVSASAIAVLIGAILAKSVCEKYISLFSGLAFVAVGIWTIAKGMKY